TPAVALLARELADEVLVSAAKDVTGTLGVVSKADLRDSADEFAELGRLDRRPSVDLREHATQGLSVVALDRVESPVDPLTDVGERGGGEERRPPRFLGHPEDVLGDVLVAILEDLSSNDVVLSEIVPIGDIVRRLLEPTAPPLERVGDVF